VLNNMNILKKSLIIFVISVLFGFTLNNAVFAQGYTPNPLGTEYGQSPFEYGQGGGNTGYNDIQQQAEEMAEDSPIKSPEQIFDILANILRYAYTIFFIVAIIFILVAAFNFLTAKDNPEKVKSARSQILWAAVAIAIALISVGAANIIYRFIETS